MRGGGAPPPTDRTRPGSAPIWVCQQPGRRVAWSLHGTGRNHAGAASNRIRRGAGGGWAARAGLPQSSAASTTIPLLTSPDTKTSLGTVRRNRLRHPPTTCKSCFFGPVHARCGWDRVVRLVERRDRQPGGSLHSGRQGRCLALHLPSGLCKATDCEPSSEHESATGVVPRRSGMAFRMDPLLLLRWETGYSSTLSFERFVAVREMNGCPKVGYSDDFPSEDRDSAASSRRKFSLQKKVQKSSCSGSIDLHRLPSR